MAVATDNHTPAGDESAVDDAFRYLTHVIGKQDDLAIYEMAESLLAGRLRMNVRHFVDGVLSSAGVVPATFWRDHLTLHVVEGRAEVRPLRALERGDYLYTLSSRDVGLLWPSRHAVTPPRQRMDTKRWIATEVERSRAADDVPSGPGAITKFSQQLAKRMAEAEKTGEVVRAIRPRRIETVLHETKLWPIQQPK